MVPTTKNIASELFLFFSRVGIPAEILTDQGTPFMSWLMVDLMAAAGKAQKLSRPSDGSMTGEPSHGNSRRGIE